jgi:6-phosphofructokinase 1
MHPLPNLKPEQLNIATLGEAQYRSPLPLSFVSGDNIGDFVSDRFRLLYEPRIAPGEELCELSFELAGPRHKLYFEPVKTCAAIVTCGGLCPGINNIIRSLVQELLLNYGIGRVLGIRFGYQGLNPNKGRPPLELTYEAVEDIHHQGGTMLGTSRGPHESKLMVDYLVSQGVDLLFCIGGDGTQRGAHDIAKEALRRQVNLGVVGIPKTIDNDIKFCFRTFGFETAVQEAEAVIDRAHVEAKSVFNGVGLVKLMGRHAGFITAAATAASGEANFCLVPEQRVKLHGDDGFLQALERRLAAKEHAVVVVAEGAGQEWLEECPTGYDASGNKILGDVGPHLANEIKNHFKSRQIPVSVKYIDPSYHIRSVPANAGDSLLCERLARAAAHAGMAGKTDVLVGLWHSHLVHVPLALASDAKREMSLESELWTSVQSVTRQQQWYRSQGGT